MGKLHLYYKKHNSMSLGQELKVKIDDTLISTVHENSIESYELPDGVHNIKMYFEGWTTEDICGYIDQNIEINGETCYEYDCPAGIKGKGKFFKKDFSDLTSFEKYTKSSNKKYTILCVLGIIVAIIILLFL